MYPPHLYMTCLYLQTSGKQILIMEDLSKWEKTDGALVFFVKVKVTQLCPTLCDPMDYTVHGILQVRILEWVACPFFRGIFPTQGSNAGLLHCTRILYQLSHKGSPHRSKLYTFYHRRPRNSLNLKVVPEPLSTGNVSIFDSFIF